MVDVIEQVFERWHEYAKHHKIEELVELYDENAVFESPLVPAILGSEAGVIVGKCEIRKFFERGVKASANSPIKWYRNGKYYSDGRTLIWEYPRVTPRGEQFDVVEVMEIDCGKIVNHRVYGGWFVSMALSLPT